MMEKEKIMLRRFHSLQSFPLLSKLGSQNQLCRQMNTTRNRLPRLSYQPCSPPSTKKRRNKKLRNPNQKNMSMSIMFLDLSKYTFDQHLSMFEDQSFFTRVHPLLLSGAQAMRYKFGFYLLGLACVH